MSNDFPACGRCRVVIERVRPAIDSGRFPIKRVIGQEVAVEADIFADGHDQISAMLRFRPVRGEWQEVPLHPLGNDRWRGAFVADALGLWEYSIVAWVERFRTWRHDLAKRLAAGQDVRVDLQIGAALVEQAATHASTADAEQLRAVARALTDGVDGVSIAQSPELALLMTRNAARAHAAHVTPPLPVVVEPLRAGFSAWYELFPRSLATTPGTHGTLADVERVLPEIAALGFDVLYLPPIHPIGRVQRKGPNNSASANPDDPGSPWAVGSAEGGHRAVHPQLGTPDDVRRLADAARRQGVELALDLALQCAPDHPYVTEHPEWFRHRPDGTIQYAENPPKRYQDIYPFDFECDAWRELWSELNGVVRHWIELGVRVFRVDNPHTKPFPFWEWLIGDIRRDYPEVFFLAEAFTRPRVMERLAKLGFSQSYTYFTWRNTKHELTEYLRALTQSELAEYFRPNFWPATPDILPEYLQWGGRPAFLARLLLAATLSPNYGIYGPAYELLEREPLEPGREEYRDSEKYALRHWNLDHPDARAMRRIMAQLNRIRREQPALQHDSTLQFLSVDNEQLLAYARSHRGGDGVIVVVVNLDPHHRQAGWLELPLETLHLDATQPYQVHDLLGGGRYLWHGRRNYVELDPAVMPGQVFRVRRRVRREHDFDYYL